MNQSYPNAAPRRAFLRSHAALLLALLVPAGAAEALSVNLEARPASIAKGGASTLEWSSSGAKWCYGSGHLRGSRPLNGSLDSGPLWQDRWYKITCSDGAREVSDALTVTIGSGSGVSVSLDADPRQVASGGSATLRWSSQGAASCTASGSWSGSRSASGSFDTGALPASRTYTLTCENGSESALASVTVQVDEVPVVHWRAPTENIDGTPLMDLSGYRFYWGARSGSYDGSARINSANWTQYQPSHLPPGEYYVAVTALDADGNESDYSNEITIQVP